MTSNTFNPKLFESFDCCLRADIDLLTGWLDAVLNGMTPRELAQLADVRDEVRERWGLGEVRG